MKLKEPPLVKYNQRDFPSVRILNVIEILQKSLEIQAEHEGCSSYVYIVCLLALCYIILMIILHHMFCNHVTHYLVSFNKSVALFRSGPEQANFEWSG